jgi:MoaA/NifB/PqqE/SkfB family radical SAM enzyme
VTYISPSAKVLANIDRVVDWRRGRHVAPVTVEWDLSNRCTLGCTACHFAHTHTRGPWATQKRVLPMAFDPCGDLADTAVVMRALQEMAHAGVKGIVWSGGGEPTTHPDWLPIVQAAAEAGLEQGMYTLGGLLTEETGARLAQLASWVVVSLDCADAETYAAEKGVPAARFEAACAGVQSLAGGPATVGVSFLLHAENWRRADAMLALARELGATYATFRPAIHADPQHPATATDDRSWISNALTTLTWLAQASDVEIDVSRFLAYRDWSGRSYAQCKGIQLTTTVTPDGRVWVCPQRRGFRGSSLGDLSRESFAAVWAKHPYAWTDFSDCRVMCRLHTVNEQIAATEGPVLHGAFV